MYVGTSMSALVVRNFKLNHHINSDELEYVVPGKERVKTKQEKPCIAYARQYTVCSDRSNDLA